MTAPALKLTEALPQQITAADVRAAIQRQFGTNGQQYAVLFEVRNGTAWRANRSVDAVVMSLWPSLGMELWGMEIKTARHDWLRELKDPGKASEVFAYFDRWFLVAPEHVAKLDELPAPWGWYVPDGASLRKRRDAEKNHSPKAVDRHFLGALLRRIAKTDDAFVSAAVDAALRQQQRQLEADIDKRALERVGDLKHDAEQWRQLHELLKDKPDDYLYLPEVVAAVRVVLKSGVAKSYGGLASLLTEVNRFNNNLQQIASDLNVELEPPKRRRRS